MNRNNLKISIVGMPQGGTTALYNIVNFIFRTNGVPVKNVLYHPKLISEKVINEQFLKKYNKNGVLLIKEHHYSEGLYDNSDLLFVQKRNIKESLISRRKRGKKFISKGKMQTGEHKYNPNTFEGFQKWCSYLIDDCYNDWINKDKSSGHNKVIPLKYLDFKQNPDLFVRGIHKELKRLRDDLNLDVEQVLKAIKDLSAYDKNITFFSPDKITSDGKNHDIEKYLNQQELNYIQNNFKDWA